MICSSVSSAGRPAELADDVASPAVIVTSRPRGAAPCETHGNSSTPCEADADSARVADPSPRNSAASPSSVAGAREPAEHGHRGARAAALASTASVGNETGREHHHATRARESGQARATPVLVLCRHRPWRGRALPRRRRRSGGPHRHAVPPSSSRPDPAHHRPHTPAARIGHQYSWSGLERRLGVDQGRTGREHERQVGRPVEPGECGGRRLLSREPPGAASPASQSVEIPVPIGIAPRYSGRCPPRSSPCSVRPASARPPSQSRWLDVSGTR